MQETEIPWRVSQLLPGAWKAFLSGGKCLVKEGPQKCEPAQEAPSAMQKAVLRVVWLPLPPPVSVALFILFIYSFWRHGLAT